MTTTKNSFIHVSTEADCFGQNVDGFDCIAEARRIRDAAEEAGIAVAFDEHRRTVAFNDDGSDRTEIDWFSTWCNVGHEWTNDQWAEWFAKFN
jgi:hypothetical protein